MSLLDDLPDRCTILKRVRTKGTLGGSKSTLTSVSTGVECWEQQASASESKKYEKEGMELRSKVYFNADRGLTRRHRIRVTSRNGSTVSSPVDLDVLDYVSPDVSVGKGLLWRAMVGRNRGESD